MFQICNMLKWKKKKKKKLLRELLHSDSLKSRPLLELRGTQHVPITKKKQRIM